MADQGIIFSAPMVRALIEGRKTQTRRLLRNPENYGCPTGDCPHDRQAECNAAMGALAFNRQAAGYAPGDRRYVREAFRLDVTYNNRKPTACPKEAAVWYEAGGHVGDGVAGKLHPSIHLPRWASRLWLAVTDVRVERLQDISEADCIAEGPKVKGWADFGLGNSLNGIMVETDQPHISATPRCWYRELWGKLHTKPGERWDDNPWVVAVTFDVRVGNIDA